MLAEDPRLDLINGFNSFHIIFFIIVTYIHFHKQTHTQTHTTLCRKTFSMNFLVDKICSKEWSNLDKQKKTNNIAIETHF